MSWPDKISVSEADEINPALVCEELSLHVDVEEILAELMPVLERYSPVMRSRAMGGWAIQSTNGSYEDGWSSEFCPYNGPGNVGPTWTPQTDSERSLKPIQNFVEPTELSTPPIVRLLEHLESLGLNPRRARIIRLSPKTESVWHTDGSRRFYQVRLHIPLLTNPGCFFETENGRCHMRADGSAYLVRINRSHRVVNWGSETRYHFVAHVWDQYGMTSRHRYFCDDNLGETTHPQNSPS